MKLNEFSPPTLTVSMIKVLSSKVSLMGKKKIFSSTIVVIVDENVAQVVIVFCVIEKKKRSKINVRYNF